MTDKQVALVGFDGNYLHVEETLDGIWGSYGITFKSKTLSDRGKFTLKKIDNRYQLLHNATNLFLGADATKETADATKQLYVIDHYEGYEQWKVGEWGDDKNLIAVVQYGDDRKKCFSVALKVEVL